MAVTIIFTAADLLPHFASNFRLQIIFSEIDGIPVFGRCCASMLP